MEPAGPHAPQNQYTPGLGAHAEATAGPVSAQELGRYLDAIVELTRQHDPQELLNTLHAALRASIGARRVRMFALSNANRDTEFNEDNILDALVRDQFDAEFGAPRPLWQFPHLTGCIRGAKPVSSEDAGSRRVVFPVFGTQHVRALLVFEGLGEETISHELLAKLLQVFSNQASMLSRSEHDPLTGLYNRQSFDDRVRRAALRDSHLRRAADGAGAPELCFALFDIDHFKQVNDQFGHLYGDEMLTLFARLMQNSFRHDDLLFRYGGEEFAVVLANADLKIAAVALQRFRQSVETFAFPQIGHKTVSIGFTALSVDQGLENIVMRADKALYFAKHHGRNQACCYETLVADGKLAPVTLAKGDIELF